MNAEYLAALEETAAQPMHPRDELAENIAAALDHFVVRMLTEHGVDGLLGIGNLPRTARLLGAVDE